MSAERLRGVDARAGRSYVAGMPPWEQSPSELVTLLDSLVGQRLEQGEALMVASDGDETLWRGDIGEALFEHALADRCLRNEALAPLLAEAAQHRVPTAGREVHDVARQLLEAQQGGSYPDREAFAMMAWCFAGWHEAELGAYADEVLDRIDWSSARRRELDPLHAWFEQSGVPLWLVSASPRTVAVAAAARIGVPADRVVAMTPATVDGVLQARLDGAPTYGAGKLERLRARSPATLLAAMGDSDYDFALLAAAEVAVAVHPSEGLRQRLHELDQPVVVLGYWSLTMAAIRISGLSKRYPARAGSAPSEAALDGLDLDVADGEFLVLVGPSGCGKSTALRLIAGLEQPSAGTVRLGDRELGGVPPQNRDVAMVFQGYALYPHLTVAQNMAFPLQMRRVDKAERRKQVGEIAELVGLGDKLQRLPSELSGGERQRVAMGRAIVRSPQLFLFDEPLSNLDAKLRADLRVELVSLVRRLGTTSIYVTHDQAEAMTMADRVAVLDRGKLQQVAPPRQIYEDPDNLFVAGFVGTPAMNQLTLPCEDGAAIADGGSLQLPAWLSEREHITVGFRPEHTALGGEGPSQLRAQVRAVEPLGPETLVYLQAAGEPLRARIHGFGGPPLDSAVNVTIASEHLLWFDADSGARLRPPRSSGSEPSANEPSSSAPNANESGHSKEG